MAFRKRDHLVSAARRAFCAHGFHATGVDAILDEAEVARMTLYKNFASKEELIVAALREEDALFREWLAASVEARSRRAEDRILNVFAALQERFASEGYYGCAFVRASVEFPDPKHPVHRAAKEHKDMMRSYLRGLASETGAANPGALAEQIYLLLEGAITASQLHGEPWPADYAGQAARELVKAAAAGVNSRKDVRRGR